ncbi:MAG: hypothetical protein R3D63_17795 [Paracoccaceae bacterium]
MPPTYPILAALAAALALFLAFRLARAAHLRRAARAGYFAKLAPLFNTTEVRLQPTGLPRMTGRRGALAYDLQALPDSLTFRKLPALWVMVSLPQPMPVGATLDLMARPSGQEPFSHFAQLPQLLPRPDFLPEGVAIRSDDATAVPPEYLLARHADLFDDPRVKELLISPRGLRVVILAEEAERGRYLLFRDAEMAQVPLAPGRVAPLLDRLARLAQDLHSIASEAR